MKSSFLFSFVFSVPFIMNLFFLPKIKDHPLLHLSTLLDETPKVTPAGKPIRSPLPKINQWVFSRKMSPPSLLPIKTIPIHSFVSFCFRAFCFVGGAALPTPNARWAFVPLCLVTPFVCLPPSAHRRQLPPKGIRSSVTIENQIQLLPRAIINNEGTLLGKKRIIRSSFFLSTACFFPGFLPPILLPPISSNS